MSHHDEGETCQVCRVLHYDGPAHICNPYATRWPEGPTDAEVKRGLNRLMSKMAAMVTDLSTENRELRQRAEQAEAEATRLTERWEALKAWHNRKLESLDVLTDEYPKQQMITGKVLAHSDTLVQMAELEATPSGPAEEGR